MVPFWYYPPQASKLVGGSSSKDNDPACDSSMRGSWLLLATLSAGAAGMAVTACQEQPSRAGAMLRELKDRRRIEPRLTGGFPYGPCRLDPAASDAVPDAQCAERQLVRHDAGSPAAKSMTRGYSQGASWDPHTSGVVELLEAEDAGDLDAAVEKLEQAVARAQGDARMRSDLAAAYIVRGERLDDPLDLVRGFSAADRAVHLDGSLSEARFNRALALEKLFLEREAEAAWRGYLVADARSAWAVEARRRLASLQPAPEVSWQRKQKRLAAAARSGDRRTIAAIVRQNPQAAREYAEQVLLSDWADAKATGQTGQATGSLALAHSIGETLAAAGGDRLVSDSVAAIEAAAADPGRLWALVEGHRWFRRGYRQYDDRNPGRAAPWLEKARQLLAHGGSPFVARARFYLACCNFLRERHARALRGFERLSRELASTSYPALLGHAKGMEAVARAVSGRVMTAVGSYEGSLAAFQRAGEEENVAWTEALLAEGLRVIGRDREAWVHGYRALRVTPKLRDPKLLYLVAQGIADSALKDGALDVALLFHDEMVRQAARRKEDHTLAAESLFWRGLMESRLGRRGQAFADLRLAARQIEQIEDPRLRERRRADLAMVEGTMMVESDPREAVARLTSALAVYQRGGHGIFTLQTRLTRAQAYRRLAEDERAQADLKAALRAYERVGEHPSGEDLRLAFLEETDAVFDEMIALQAARQPDVALAYADYAHTRVLPATGAKLKQDPREWLHLLTTEPRPVGIAEIRRRLPPGTAVIQFSVLEDQLLIWLLQRQGRDGEIPFFKQRVPRKEIEKLVAEVRTFRHGQEAAWNEASTRLFDLVIRPWRSLVRDGDLVIFVPDKVLHAVPFACLKNRETGRFLIADSRIALAPSATLYAETLTRQPADTLANRPQALILGDPAFDLASFHRLTPLPFAADEARRIAALYGVQPRVGQAADRESFLALAPQAGMIHFAGHSVVDARNPLQSALLLTPSRRRGPGVLSAREIYSMKLDSTHLVVLAACDSGKDYIPGSEGVTSLARAFLAAGAHTVVASLWNVNDRVTSKLFEVFHHNLLAHQDPVRALREAQLALMASRKESERSPAVWGAFEVFGASSN
jgi:CHAT domain-containing protein